MWEGREISVRYFSVVARDITRPEVTVAWYVTKDDPSGGNSREGN